MSARIGPRFSRRRWKTFDALYQRYFGLVWSVVRRLGVTQSAAEDVAQDAWLAVYRSLDKLRADASAKAFVAAIARHTVLHHHRSRHRQDRKQQAVLDTAPTQTDDDQERVEARHLVEGLIAELDEQQGLVLVLMHGHGLSAQEVADAIDENVNTVYSRLRLARARVRRHAARLQLEEQRLTAHLLRQEAPPRQTRARVAAAIALKLPTTAAVTAAGSVKAFAGTLGLGTAALVGIAVAIPDSGRASDPATAPVVAIQKPARNVPRAPEPLIPEPPAPTPTAVLEPAETPVQAAVAPVKPRPTPQPVPANSLAAETEILGEAKSALDRGDATAALSLLDRHRREFPNGELADVRRGARVRALCHLGRNKQAQAEAAALIAASPGSAVAHGTKDVCRDG